jgi:hypothetical protein
MASGLAMASGAAEQAIEASVDSVPVISAPPAAGEAEPSPVLSPRAEPVAEAPRSKPSDALMRALMVITSAGGGRPFPLVPR